MTCIVGLVQDGRVYMAGDSAGSNYQQIVTRLDKKVFRVGDMLIGICGSFRMGQLLRHALVLPAHPDTMDTDEYMVLKFVEAVRTVFTDGGYIRKVNEEEQGGNFLVGYRGRLFEIQGDFQVGEIAGAYNAIGNGGEVALGYMYATPHLEPEDRLQRALQAASYHCIGVRGPWHTLSIHESERTYSGPPEEPPEQPSGGSCEERPNESAA